MAGINWRFITFRWRASARRCVGRSAAGGGGGAASGWLAGPPVGGHLKALESEHSVWLSPGKSIGRTAAARTNPLKSGAASEQNRPTTTSATCPAQSSHRSAPAAANQHTPSEQSIKIGSSSSSLASPECCLLIAHFLVRWRLGTVFASALDYGLVRKCLASERSFELGPV